MSQTVRFCIRDGRCAGLDHLNFRTLRKLPPYFFYDRDRGIGKPVDGEENFVVWIILGEEAAQIFFQAVVLSTKRFQNANGGWHGERGQKNAEVTARLERSQRAKHPRTDLQQN